MNNSTQALIKKKVSLKNKNWFNTGGLAAYCAEPITLADYLDSIKWAHDHQIPITILGAGANVLISDSGIDGLVLRPATTSIEIVAEHTNFILIRAGAGCSIDALIEWCLNHHIVGLEEFSGIPGTVGGSVYINLHYYQFLLEHFLYEARLIDICTGAVITVPVSWFEFDYDVSKLHEKNHILFDATFTLKKADPLTVAYARGRRAEIIRHRAARYPTKNTCGSFFRNFLSHEVTLESNNKKMTYVAYYLDKIGVKGSLSVGDAIVSYQHANMIVNKGNATSAHIIDLARTMQAMVYDNFGIIPHPECQLLGFKTYPLL